MSQCQNEPCAPESPVVWHRPSPSNEAIASLVQDGRVHSRIYTDQSIFDLEMERIFHRSWIYIGHESEVPRAGDFQARRMGRTPVLMVRGGTPRCVC